MGFSPQIQPSQSSAPAGKNAGLSSMQLGQNPIQQSPQDQLLKTQQLQAEQPNFSQANQMPEGLTPQDNPMSDNGQIASMDSAMSRGMGMLGGSPAQQLQNPYQAQLNNNSPMGAPQGKGGAQGKVTFPGQGGQPQIGMPNAYSNTMQPWDNQGNQQGLGQGLGGKGLGNAVGQMSKPTGKGA